MDGDPGIYNEGSHIVPSCALDNVVIHNTNTTQSITDSRTLIDNDHVSSSGSMIQEISSQSTCNVSIPMQCPAQEDVITNNQLSKRKYRTEIDEQNEFDERSLSLRRDQCLPTSDGSNYDQTKKLSIEMVDKQNAYFPHEHISLSTRWYVYRINISNNNDLGFVVPCELIKLPKFNLYENKDELRVQLLYVRSIDYKECRNQLEDFYWYLFDDVFNDINTELHSTFNLLPCLLKQSGELDYQRMASICHRKTKSIQNLKKRIKESSIDDFEKASSTMNNKLNSPTTKLYDYPIGVHYYAPLDQTDFELISKLSSILVRILQLSGIEQLKQLLPDNIQPYSFLNVDQMPIVTFDDYPSSILSPTQSSVLPLVSLNYDLLSKDNCEYQPSPDLLSQSIARCSTAEDANKKNLETLADSFLRFAMSMSLYHQHPFNEKLTLERNEPVSNKKLYQLAMRKEFKDYLSANEIKYGDKETSWFPSNYKVDEKDSDKCPKQKSKCKPLADTIESLIGAVLISTDYLTAIKFMKWLGLDIIPMDNQNEIMKPPSVLCPDLSDTMNEVKVEELFSNRAFAEIEKKIKYNFKNKAYLIAAFTHGSRSKTTGTIKNKRLKFVGNSLLEFLITRYSFVTVKSVTSGHITDVRQDLLNNECKADIMVANGLHTKIICSSPSLINPISSYTADKDLSIDENNVNQWSDSVEKAVADALEALIAAVFFDSNYSLKSVWDVICLLFRQYTDLDYSIKHPKLNSVRLIHEQGGKITNEFIDDNGNCVCDVTLSNGVEVKGYGKNKSNTMTDDNKSKTFVPLSYQAEIMEQAKSENLIVCLPTGSGKTFIVVMLIKEWLPDIRPSLTDGGKRTILLVNTVELARQHYETMSDHFDLKTFKIGIYTGSSKIRHSDQWNNEFENHPVLIFTAQIFLDLLARNHFQLDKVNLLIFDECHHATGNHQYAIIMKEYYKSCRNPPRILGLTASISGQKIEPHELPKVAKELETILHARIETGSDRMEIARNSTSVDVKSQRCLNYEQKIRRGANLVKNIFKEIKLLYEELDKYLKTKKKNQNGFENNPSKINDPSNFLQLQCRTLNQLKSHLDNIIHIGYDLGLYGFSSGIIALRDYLKSKNVFITITDQTEKDLYDKILNKLDNLINDHLTNLTEDRQILFSKKVIEVENYIKENQHGQTIVFVERVYTAALLCQVLRKIFNNSIQIKYLAGSKAYIDGISVSAKYQREVAREFRHKGINVLISTAIIEEGLDVQACNLVIRFNKPQNFASYMQSKGRARAKEKALFVLLHDENDIDEFINNKEEYKNYEYIEKMLKRNFKSDGSEDSSSDDINSLESYRPGNGVKISGIHAVQTIYQYCAVLGNGQILSPRFCFYYLNQSNKFRCILSMPGNCPIREDIICENRNKKVAKQECCLKMVEKLHKIDELDQYCLPIRPERPVIIDDTSDDEETEKVPIEMIDKQFAYFPLEYASLSTQWHLYRINISNNDDLGFIVPSEIMKLPIFKLYGRDSELTVEVIYLKSIDLEQYEYQLEEFCRYIFEVVFDKMNTELKSILKFDIKHSTFKLLPCLLKKSGDIDYQRMASICDRKNKLIQNPSELNDYELYYPSHSSDKQFYMNISDNSLLKRASHLWEHKRPVETIECYADYFEYKVPGIHIQRDYLLATMKTFRKPRINYLNNSLLRKEKESTISSTKPEYYPIEVLRYAPLNQTDFELISKLPSILARISQLYYIEQMRKLLADNIQSYTLLDVDQMSIVSFNDCLSNIFSSTQSNVLPLVSLNYDLLSKDNGECQPLPDLLFQAITRRSAAERTDMENLEILGDCFLKLAMSMSLYHQYPFDSAGKITSEKDKQVSNENLYRLATKKELKKYLYFNRLNFGGKEANWLPPGYKTDEENSDRYLKQRAKRKAFADMIEALIGAFLISTDYSTTIKFMNWLGLNVIPTDEHRQIMKTPSILCRDLSDTMNEVNINIQKLFSDRAFDEIEKEINYNFKNKAYLIAAFTHPSYYNNRFTQCYERLEYLGDAVLDFLVIRCIFVEHYNRVTPSRVTDIRQDLANNGRLAYLLASWGLHTKILHLSPTFFYRITIYLNDETLFPKTKDKLSNDIDQWADSKAPKVLADVFEALVGAIFLDSGYSLETVWKIIEPLLRLYINRSIEHPNLNPIRTYFEHEGKKLIYESNDGNGDFICHAQLPDGPEITGYGKNKWLAKYDACRKAMNHY